MLQPCSRGLWEVAEVGGIGVLRLKADDAEWLILFDLIGSHSASLKGEPICSPSSRGAWSVVLSTNEQRFGGSGEPVLDLQTMEARFAVPAVIVLRS